MARRSCRAPRSPKLTEAWRLASPPRRSHYDLAIVGAGPAGLAAAVYAASDGLEDLNGYVMTGPDLLEQGRRPADWPLDRDPLALETSRPGLFAAGDARSGSTKRVGSAVGEGAMAVALSPRRLVELAAG